MPPDYTIQISSLIPLASNPPALIDRISMDMLGRLLDDNVRDIIVGRMNYIPDWFTAKPWLAEAYDSNFDTAVALAQVNEAIYLIITSPQYLIER